MSDYIRNCRVGYTSAGLQCRINCRVRSTGDCTGRGNRDGNSEKDECSDDSTNHAHAWHTHCDQVSPEAVNLLTAFSAFTCASYRLPDTTEPRIWNNPVAPDGL